MVILGGAESGVGAAVLAKVKGFDVFLSDNGSIKEEYIKTLREWDIPFEQGGHTESLILNADEVVKSPGIPSTAPMVRKLTEQGTHIISEIEFAARYDNAKKVCITGSNGKTTTTSIIYYLLQNAGLNVGLGGNIGKSYAMQVATEQHDYYVLEISSFQLDNCYDFRPDIAIITNITPDHLDRYDYNFENYIRAKFRITQNLRPEDCFIFDSDDAITIEHLDKIVLQAKMLPFTQKTEVSQGAFLRDDKIVVRYEQSESEIYLKELALGGRHNIYNSMAAALAAKAAGIDNEVIRNSLKTFKAVEHRLESVLSVGGVLYINDSTLALLRRLYCCSLKCFSVLLEKFICHIRYFTLCLCCILRMLKTDGNYHLTLPQRNSVNKSRLYLFRHNGVITLDQSYLWSHLHGNVAGKFEIINLLFESFHH